MEDVEMLFTYMPQVLLVLLIYFLLKMFSFLFVLKYFYWVKIAFCL